MEKKSLKIETAEFKISFISAGFASFVEFFFTFFLFYHFSLYDLASRPRSSPRISKSNFSFLHKN